MVMLSVSEIIFDIDESGVVVCHLQLYLVVFRMTLMFVLSVAVLIQQVLKEYQGGPGEARITFSSTSLNSSTPDLLLA